jgi:hypothetical protein
MDHQARVKTNESIGRKRTEATLWPRSRTKIKTELSVRGKEPVKSKAETPIENKTHEPQI